MNLLPTQFDVVAIMCDSNTIQCDVDIYKKDVTCEPILFMCLFALIDHGSHVGALGRKSVFGNLFP